ncbi:hypothetical protein TcCL_ESM08999 [Trypanosoma cruzi]|nr:hypothetical protein TcCL_ESM08999 [Trypanosoma cruzi]
MSGTCGGANGVVEELEVLLEGDALPHREPFVRRGRPPSKRKPKRCEMMPEFGTVTTAVVDGLEGTLSAPIDDDGVFTMRSRFRKDAEMDKQKHLIANAGLVAQTLTTDSLPPVGAVAPVKKEMERSSFYISGEEAGIGLQASGFCMEKTKKEASFSPLTEPTPWNQPAFEEFRNDYDAVDAGCFFIQSIVSTMPLGQPVVRSPYVCSGISIHQRCMMKQLISLKMWMILFREVLLNVTFVCLRRNMLGTRQSQARGR